MPQMPFLYTIHFCDILPHKTLVIQQLHEHYLMIKVITVHIVLINYILHQVAHAPLFTKQRVSIIVDAHLLAEID